MWMCNNFLLYVYEFKFIIDSVLWINNDSLYVIISLPVYFYLLSKSYFFNKKPRFRPPLIISKMNIQFQSISMSKFFVKNSCTCCKLHNHMAYLRHWTKQPPFAVFQVLTPQSSRREDTSSTYKLLLFEFVLVLVCQMNIWLLHMSFLLYDVCQHTKICSMERYLIFILK